MRKALNSTRETHYSRPQKCSESRQFTFGLDPS